MEIFVGTVVGVAMLVVAFYICLLPAVIAFKKDHDSKWAIFWINLLFGWTFIVWVICLIWAISGLNNRAMLKWSRAQANQTVVINNAR